MKTYVLTVSEFFPKTHNKAGLPTGFINSISNKSKKHTIRGNYELWKKRFEKINKGEACLSVRYWTGKPYRSSQKEVYNLTNTDGIGLEIISDFGKITAIVRKNLNDIKAPIIRIEDISKNDGLRVDDFQEWFKKYDLSQPMAIIHFTSFRYWC